MSDSIKNVAIFGATGMTGLATLAQAAAAGEKLNGRAGQIRTLTPTPLNPRQRSLKGRIETPN